MTGRDCDPPPAQGDEPTLWRPALRLCSQPESLMCQGCFPLSSLVTTPLARADCPLCWGCLQGHPPPLQLRLVGLHDPPSPKVWDNQEDQPCPVSPRSPVLIWQVEGGGSGVTAGPEDRLREKSLNSVPPCFSFPRSQRHAGVEHTCSPQVIVW